MRVTVWCCHVAGFLKSPKFFIPNETFKEWNKNHVLIPVNIHTRHSVLIVLSMKKNCIVYLDPFGGFDDENKQKKRKQDVAISENSNFP